MHAAAFWRGAVLLLSLVLLANCQLVPRVPLQPPSRYEWRNRRRSAVSRNLRMDDSSVIRMRDFPEGSMPVDIDAPVEVPCSMERGKFRSGGSTFSASTVDTSAMCCALCDEMTACNSWNFEKATGRCQLIHGDPPTRNNPKFDTGTTF